MSEEVICSGLLFNNSRPAQNSKAGENEKHAIGGYIAVVAESNLLCGQGSN